MRVAAARSMKLTLYAYSLNYLLNTSQGGSPEEPPRVMTLFEVIRTLKMLELDDRVVRFLLSTLLKQPADPETNSTESLPTSPPFPSPLCRPTTLGLLSSRRSRMPFSNSEGRSRSG